MTQRSIFHSGTKKNPRLGFVARNLQQPGFGISTLTVNLYKSIRSLKSNDEMLFFTDTRDGATQNQNNLYPIGGNTCSKVSKFYWDHFSLPHACRKYDIDTILFPYHVRAVFLHCRSVVVVHDLMYHLFPNYWSNFERAYMQLGTEHSLRKADAIVVPSESTAQDIRRMFPQSACKIHVIPYGISEDFVPKNKDKVEKARHSFNIVKDFVLVIGSDHPRKNTRVALEIFKSVQHVIPHDFVFIGPSFGIDTTWKSISATCELRERVKFLGLVTQDELVNLLSGAAMLLFPSLYEGFGFPVLEAMACGCPVLGFHTSSLPEIAGSAGRLVPLKDNLEMKNALLDLLHNPNELQRMSTVGKIRAAEYRWTDTAQRILEVMRNVSKIK